MHRAPQPNNVSVQNDGSALRLVYRWFTWRSAYILVIALVWNYVVWSGFMPSLLRGSNAFEISPFMFVPLVMGLAGIGIAYYALAGVFNSTLITTDRVELRVSHRPFPWIGNHTLLCSDIEQLYCEETIGNLRGSGRVYQLNVITRDNRKRTILSGLAEAGIVIFIEQEFESYLGIRDQHIAGEYHHK